MRPVTFAHESSEVVKTRVNIMEDICCGLAKNYERVNVMKETDDDEIQTANGLLY